MRIPFKKTLIPSAEESFIDFSDPFYFLSFFVVFFGDSKRFLQ
jgi:hypothetical protein